MNGPAHMAEGGHRLRNAPNPHPQPQKQGSYPKWYWVLDFAKAFDKVQLIKLTNELRLYGQLEHHTLTGVANNLL